LKLLIAPTTVALAWLFAQCALPGGMAYAQKPDLNCAYERDTVSVSGQIHRKRHKVAADDEDSYLRGRTDRAVMLKLRHALCVMRPDDVHRTPRPHRVHEVQLLANERLPRSSDKIRHVEGILLLNDEAHQQAPVQLEVKQLDEGRKPSSKHR
jgi:hypothetical protein